jgi:hypothetical protein
MRIDISASRREQILAANQALIQAQKDIAIVGALVEGAGGNPGRKFTTAIDHDPVIPLYQAMVEAL